MNTFHDIGSLKKHLKSQRTASNNIGFVPTMGALHQGHLALIEKSVRDNDLTVCSIYVNPTQFNNVEDLEKYPRSLEADLQILKDTGCDMAFCPDSREMYTRENPLKFNLGYLEETMEGKFRPGHFNGVCLAVAKLFNIVQPDVAYFGRKDLQQFVVISQMRDALMFDIKLKCVDTIREKDGLASSSRNSLLPASDRTKAIIFYQALQFAREKLLSGQSVEAVRIFVGQLFNSAESQITLEYFDIVDTQTLRPIKRINSPEGISLCIAGYVGNVRLIDNISLN